MSDKENIVQEDENSIQNIDESSIQDVVIEKKSGKSKRKTSSRNFKLGMYNSILIVVVIAFVILLNLFVGQLNIKVDLTPNKVYTLTSDTKKMADGLKDEITIYFLAKEKDQYKVLKNVIAEYDKLPHVSVVNKDPELYPQFASKYTDQELQGNDVIVVDEAKGTSKFVPFDQMYIQDYSMNYQTYSQEYSNNLDAEGQITSAIQYVTASKHDKMYTVTSHGETAIGENVQKLIQKANVDTADFNAISETSIPDDCNILMINGPTSDISEEELTMYKDYLDKGGKAILTTTYTPEDMKNYNSLLEYYGVKVNEGIVIESQGNYLQNPTYPVDYFNSVTDEISSDFTTQNFVIMPFSKPLTVQDTSGLRSTLTTKSIIVTTDESYSKVDSQSENIEKEAGDIDGPFDLVVQASDKYKDTTSKVCIFASPYIFAEDWVDYSRCSNIDLLISSLNWMSDSDAKTIAIPQRSLDDVKLEVPQKDAYVWAVITILIIPLGILMAGFVVWYMRRKH